MITKRQLAITSSVIAFLAIAAKLTPNQTDNKIVAILGKLLLLLGNSTSA